MKTITTTQAATITSAAASAGLILGLVYAFKTKRKFWGYVGFGLLGSIVLGSAVGIPMSLMSVTPPKANGVKLVDISGQITTSGSGNK